MEIVPPSSAKMTPWQMNRRAFPPRSLAHGWANRVLGTVVSGSLAETARSRSTTRSNSASSYLSPKPYPLSVPVFSAPTRTAGFTTEVAWGLMLYISFFSLLSSTLNTYATWCLCFTWSLFLFFLSPRLCICSGIDKHGCFHPFP